VAYLLITWRVRAAATAAAVFAAPVVTGFALLPSQSYAFWLGGVFLNENRVGNPVTPDSQSRTQLSGKLRGTQIPAQATGVLTRSRPRWPQPARGDRPAPGSLSAL
jgi:hypothetical protein